MTTTSAYRQAAQEAAVAVLIGRIAGSQAVQKHLGPPGLHGPTVADWVGLLDDPRLSTGEGRLARLAYRIARETGQLPLEEAHPDQSLREIDVIEILAHVSPTYQATVLDAIRLMVAL